MKRSVFLLTLLLMLALTACASSEEPPVCGGIVDHSVPDAPKTIASEELTSVQTYFYVYTDARGDDGSFYEFELTRGADGAAQLAEKSVYGVSSVVNDDVFAQAQYIIASHDLARLNGTDRCTSALAPEYQPCLLRAEYASGETLYFRMDGDPTAEWAGELASVFRSAFVQAGCGEKLLTPAMRQLSEDSAAAYEAFLSGEAGVYFDRYLPSLFDYYESDWDESVFESGTPYTLSDFARLLSGTDGDASTISFSRASIDCGCDGISELVLAAYDEDWMGSYEFVIKYLDGRLQVLYSTQSLYRESEQLANPYGLVSTSGSISAWEHVYSLSLLGAEGEHHFLWSENEMYGLGQFDMSAYPVFQLAWEKGMNEDNILVRTYLLHDPAAEGNYDPDVYVIERYDGETYELLDSADLYAPDSPYRALFAEANAVLVTQDEADALVAQRELAFGAVGALAQIGGSDCVPLEVDRARADASARDIAVVFRSPSPLLCAMAGESRTHDEYGDAFVLMALHDGTRVRIDSGEPVFDDAYVLTGWSADGTLYEGTLNAGELLQVELNAAEGMPNRCIIAETDENGEVLCALWPVQYDGRGEGGSEYIRAAEW